MRHAPIAHGHGITLSILKKRTCTHSGAHCYSSMDRSCLPYIGEPTGFWSWLEAADRKLGHACLRRGGISGSVSMRTTRAILPRGRSCMNRNATTAASIVGTSIKKKAVAKTANSTRPRIEMAITVAMPTFLTANSTARVKRSPVSQPQMRPTPKPAPVPRRFSLCSGFTSNHGGPLFSTSLAAAEPWACRVIRLAGGTAVSILPGLHQEE